MGISISGMNKIHVMHAGSYGAINAPNWQITPHKGMKTPPKGEFIQQIKDLAAKRAEAVTDEDYATVNYQEEVLSAQYLSSVSPDRKTLYKEAIQVIKGKTQTQDNAIGDRTILDFLNEKEGLPNGLQNGEPYTLSSGATITPVYNSRGGYDYNISVDGNVVMSSSQGLGGWTFTMTPAELQKREEFNTIFDSAYQAAKNSQSTQTRNLLDRKV